MCLLLSGAYKRTSVLTTKRPKEKARISAKGGEGKEEERLVAEIREEKKVTTCSFSVCVRVRECLREGPRAAGSLVFPADYWISIGTGMGSRKGKCTRCLLVSDMTLDLEWRRTRGRHSDVPIRETNKARRKKGKESPNEVNNNL